MKKKSCSTELAKANRQLREAAALLGECANFIRAVESAESRNKKIAAVLKKLRGRKFSL